MLKRRTLIGNLVGLLFACSAVSASYSVDDVGDGSDANPGDGMALTAGGVTTLRAAIEEANANPDADTITFDLTSPSTITLTAPLVLETAITIDGPGAEALTIDGANAHRPFDVIEDAMIRGLTIQNGLGDGPLTADLFAGAIRHTAGTLVVEECDLRDNASTAASALYSSGEFLVMRDCRLLNNSAGFGGGVVLTEHTDNVELTRCDFEGNTGRAQFGEFQSAGPFELMNCSFNVQEGPVAVRGFNGSILDCRFEGSAAGVDLISDTHVEGCFFTGVAGSSIILSGSGSARVSNTVVTGSTFGPAIDFRKDGIVLNCSVIGNASAASDNGSIYSAGREIEIGNTVVAGNVAEGVMPQDLAGAFISLGGNFIGAGDDATGIMDPSDQVGTSAAPLDPMLSTLGAFGGRGMSIVPLPGSPLVDAGVSAVVSAPGFTGPPFFDLRGEPFARIYGDSVDIGATEAQPDAVGLLTGYADVDTNNDGVLDETEILTAQDYLTGDLVAGIDLNGDGDVNVPELLTISGVTFLHRGDYNADQRLSLAEVLRIVQFYNADGYQCASSPGDTEDGYLSGTSKGADPACVPHSADYAEPQFVIGLSEILRVIQLFNAGGHMDCPASETEDGFCATGLT